MKVATKLIFFPLFSLCAVLFLAGIAVYTSREMGRGLEENGAADNIVRHTASLDILTYEYLLHKMERPRQQWSRTHSRIGTLIGSTRLRDVKESEILHVIEEKHGAIGRTFARILEVCAEPVEAGPRGDVTRELETRLVGQLLLDSQAMVSAANTLSERISRRMLKVQRLLNIYRVLAFAVILGVVLTASLLIRRSITRPLKILHAGTAAIGGGDLTHRIDINSPDEMGELARAFNAMVRSLNATQTSLHEEIAVRKQTESELLEHREHLEELVAQRTTELEATNQSLRDKEQRLEQALEELTRSNKELEQFAYVASHDLQEPLRKVKSFIELLERRYEGALDERGKGYIKYVVDGASRMQGLIQDLLTYSRVGRRELECAPTDLRALIDDVVLSIETTIREAGAELEIGPMPTLAVSPKLMGLVFQNLIANAVKFRKPGRPPVVSVSAEKRDTEWVLTVRDNGIGMKAEHFERAFQIFQRLHARSEYPGTGIGLAVCKKIVERHGGRIWVESVPEQGSAFHVVLPGEHDGAPGGEAGDGAVPSTGPGEEGEHEHGSGD